MQKRYLEYNYEFRISEGYVMVASSFGGGREEADRT